jgi:leader peptidase (prepilin peptidase)/N-methyltransferase
VLLVASGGAVLFFLCFSLASPSGMGMGDVKLAGVLGLYLGRAVAPAILIALVAGVVLGAAIIARKGAKEGRKTAVPFGPFLALGGMVAFFVGNELVDAYLDTF